MNDTYKPNYELDYNLDPISGETGSHPVGLGLGTTGGAALGAAAGAIAGPLGVAAGAVIGGLPGKGVGEVVNPTAEDAHWAAVHLDQPFARLDLRLEDYQPAYRIGYLGASRYASEGRRFDDVEAQLEAEYAQSKGDSALVWEQAKLPARAAWDRIAETSRPSPQ